MGRMVLTIRPGLLGLVHGLDSSIARYLCRADICSRGKFIVFLRIILRLPPR